MRGPRERTASPRTLGFRFRYVAILLAWLVVATALAADPRLGDEVAWLIDRVRTSGCTFVRNGTAHDAAQAADHLAMKFRRGRRHVHTAEQFIDRLASRSSMTGRPYAIACGDTSQPAGAWLHEALDRHRVSVGDG